MLPWPEAFVVYFPIWPKSQNSNIRHEGIGIPTFLTRKFLGLLKKYRNLDFEPMSPLWANLPMICLQLLLRLYIRYFLWWTGGDQILGKTYSLQNKIFWGKWGLTWNCKFRGYEISRAWVLLFQVCQIRCQRP
jgi:hypothetical protein